MLLKKLKGITKDIKIEDAKIIYTEPHSKRQRIRLTISKEIALGLTMKKSIIITFVEKNLQCASCMKSFTPHTWHAVVQLRQKVKHKKTFLFLEQMILKNNAHAKCIKVTDDGKFHLFVNLIIYIDDGLNFYFRHSPDALNLMEFIQNQVIVRIKQGSKLISHDERNGTVNKKLSISIEIPPICRDDLVLLPSKLSRECGGIGPLVLCYKISKVINIVDPITMETYEIDAASYWKNPFGPLLTRSQLVPYRSKFYYLINKI